MNRDVARLIWEWLPIRTDSRRVTLPHTVAAVLGLPVAEVSFRRGQLMACENRDAPAPESEYPEVVICRGSIAVRFDDRATYLILTPDGTVTERYTLGGVA